MAQEFTTPADFPQGDDEIEKGDSKKFIIEAECTKKDDDGKMTWEIETIDGVRVEGGGETDDGNAFEGYDSSSDKDPDDDVSSDGKAKTTKGIGLVILGKK